MNIEDLIERVKSGVLNISFIKDNHVLAKGTGFMCKEFLITNKHVFDAPKESSHVCIKVYDSNVGITLEYPEFNSALRTSSDKNNYDFAVLDIPKLHKLKLYNFTLSNSDNIRIGRYICFLGYPLEHDNLVCHDGVISSFYMSNNTKIIQINASVNAGNSGGPLIDPSTGKVIGIITLKATGLSVNVNKFKELIKSDINLIQNSGSIARIGSVDLVKEIVNSHNQYLNIVDEIERSANVGIGYAFSAQHLLEDNFFRSIEDK